MRKVFHTLLLLGLMTLPCVSLAGPAGTTAATGMAAGTSSSLYVQNGFSQGLLDPSVPLGERIKLFSKVIALANGGHVRAQELAGTLYWQGSKIAGSPVQQNLKQARILLANAAVHGDVPAMAKLAELELSAGRLQQAMIWSQLYAHYLDPVHSPRQKHGRNFAYASDLLDRIIKAGGKLDEKVSRNVNAMSRKFNTGIRDGMATFRELRRSGDTYLIRGPHRERLFGDDTHLSGVVDYMVAFNPSGKATHAWMLASYPTDAIADVVKRTVNIDYARANPVSDEASMRYIRVSVQLYGNRERVLELHH